MIIHDFILTEREPVVGTEKFERRMEFKTVGFSRRVWLLLALLVAASVPSMKHWATCIVVVVILLEELYRHYVAVPDGYALVFRSFTGELRQVTGPIRTLLPIGSQLCISTNVPWYKSTDSLPLVPMTRQVSVFRHALTAKRGHAEPALQHISLRWTVQDPIKALRFETNLLEHMHDVCVCAESDQVAIAFPDTGIVANGVAYTAQHGVDANATCNICMHRMWTSSGIVETTKNALLLAKDMKTGDAVTAALVRAFVATMASKRSVIVPYGASQPDVAASVDKKQGKESKAQ